MTARSAKRGMAWMMGAAMAAALLLAAPAQAADLPRVQPVTVTKAPVATPQPVFSWTGFYIGANGAYTWGSGGDGLGFDPQGWMAGGTVGYNYQLPSNVVLGIEGDLAGGDISKGEGPLSSKLDVLGTVRGRLGYALGPILPYATGGLAIGNNTITDYGISSSNTHVGWTAGAGVEFAISDHWTAKTEYLYTDLGSKTYDNIGQDVGVSGHTAKFGVNYKF